MARAGSISFTAVEAANLAQMDVSTDTDPFVRWSLGDETLAETHFLRNVLGRRGGKSAGSERIPKWDSEYVADLPTGFTTGRVVVSLWDSDSRRNQPLGNAAFEISASTDNQRMTLDLQQVPGGLRSTVTFTVTVELPVRPPPEPEPPEPEPEPSAPVGPVVRKEIRTMSPEEQTRYALAIKKMMEDTNGPESSEFFRLAGYHGWPGNGAARNYSYCEHRQEVRAIRRTAGYVARASTCPR